MVYLIAKQLKCISEICFFSSIALLGNNCIAQTPQALELYNQALAATCANCHGTDRKGVIDGGMPLIQSIQADKMLNQLLAYKSGSLEGTIMPQLMKGYSIEQIQIIANQLGKHQ